MNCSCQAALGWWPEGNPFGGGFGITELRYLRPASEAECRGGDPDAHVFCKACCMPLKYNSVLGHFTERMIHRIDLDVIKTWASYRDGNLLKNKTRDPHLFKEAWARLHQAGGNDID